MGNDKNAWETIRMHGKRLLCVGNYKKMWETIGIMLKSVTETCHLLFLCSNNLILMISCCSTTRFITSTTTTTSLAVVTDSQAATTTTTESTETGGTIFVVTIVPIFVGEGRPNIQFGHKQIDFVIKKMLLMLWQLS